MALVPERRTVSEPSVKIRRGAQQYTKCMAALRWNVVVQCKGYGVQAWEWLWETCAQDVFAHTYSEGVCAHIVRAHESASPRLLMACVLSRRGPGSLQRQRHQQAPQLLHIRVGMPQQEKFPDKSPMNYS